MMDNDALESNTFFKPGDLIWAKMKGFPPWPAKVLEKGEDTPVRRIPVMFFGTLETSFMKPTDLSDYLTNRTVHEIPRKQKDFNKAVHEIRKAAGLASDQDDSAFPVTAKSPPSSPSTGRTRQNSERFLNVIMSSGLENSKQKRSNSASTKSRSRASSTTSTFKAIKDLMKKERRRLDSESSHGSKRKMISGGISDVIDTQYADSTDFNALFGDALLGDFSAVSEDNKSWKSKRSRCSSKIIDDFLFNHHRTRNRSGSGSGRRSRLISMSGFSGVSDMFEDLFSGNVDIDAHAEQLMTTLNNMPSEGSIDRPLSPELLAPALPGPVEFCQNCGFECRIFNGVWRCNSAHCAKYKEASASAVKGLLDEEIQRKTDVPLSVIIKKESESSDEKINHSVDPEGLIRDSHLKVEQKQQSSKKSKNNNVVSCLKNDNSIKSKNDSVSNGADKRRRKVQVMSPRSPKLPHSVSSVATGENRPSTSTSGLNLNNRLSPSPRRDRARPKHYKVEETPPISATGHRHCVNCNGQVRPQMCGGNRHRWRCVDKKCRKWYGWVRSHEEIPKNVGRKKINVKSASVKPSKLKKKEDEDDFTLPVIKRKVGRPSKHDIKIRLKLQKEAAVAMASRPQTGLHDNSDSQLTRRKYTKRKNKDSSNSEKNESVSKLNDDSKKRVASPLPDRLINYRPCAMEKRARWWTGEKRRVDVSPERELGTTAADTAAAFRMMANAVRSAAVTRADEVGTVNGSLDLLMDTLIGSMAPLLSLLQKLPAYKLDEKLSQQFWDSSVVHIPTFQ